jgi:tetratricopeptide (TPR) repeat protein/ADP-heptose:LPS heptosyltransferase
MPLDSSWPPGLTSEMSEIEDLDLEFAEPPESNAVVETLWQEAALARRYGDTDPALEAYRRILALDPSHAEARLAAAETCRTAGRPRDALRFCLELLEADPQHVACRLELAEILRRIDQPEESRAIIDILLLERPDSVHVWCGLARLLADQDRLPGAEAVLRRALRLNPGHAAAWALLGRVLARRGDGDEAVDAFHAAITLAPEVPAHQVGLAETLIGLGRADEAAAHLDRALALDDEDAPARMARAGLRLLHGRLEEAWEDTQWRHLLPGARRPLFPATPWEGGDLDGAHLLLHAGPDAADGLCEMLMAARFVAPLAERCAALTLAVPPPLAPLLAALPGVTRVVPVRGDPPGDTGARFCAELDDLPRLLGVGLHSIPASPYLAPPPGRVRRIRVPAGIRIKVGIAWEAERPEDSVPFPALLDLATVPGSLLFSLETGESAAEARLRADPALVTDLSPTVADLADLAGRIAEMDLVVAADGPAAHLAAAMGKPVLLLLPRSHHPRWMRERTDTPWYPTMELLRQPAPGEWRPLLEEVRRRIGMLAEIAAERDEAQLRRESGAAAFQRAFLAAHLRPGDLLIDVCAGSGDAVFTAVEHTGGQILALALEPSAGEAEILRDTLAVAGLDDHAEVIAVAAGAVEGGALASRSPRHGGMRVFPLPGWRAAAVPVRPLAAILDERPQLAGCRVVVRLGQAGWEDEAVAGLDGRAAVIVLEHREGSAAADRLQEAGYGLWRLAGGIAAGPAVPFLGEEGPLLALAPGLAPAAHYGPASLPPPPALVAAEAERAAAIAAPAAALQAEDRVAEAARLYGEALAVDPFCPMANANLAVLQHMAGKREAAVAGFRRALAGEALPAVMANLGAALLRMGDLGGAEAMLEAALAEDRNNPDLLHDVALLRRDQGRQEDAMALMCRACATESGHARHAWALGQLLLGTGELAGGLKLLERRPTPPTRAPRLPFWGGGDAVATAILVEIPDDPADAVMLARFIPQLAGRGALVSVACPDDLAPLLAELPGIERVIGEDSPPPACQCRVPLAALPGLLGAVDAGGTAGAYLVAGRGRRAGRDDRLRVGLTWSSRGGAAACPLGDMLALGTDPAFSLLALADEPDLARIEEEGADSLVERPIPQPADLGELATVISGLDVVVGGDTVALHLAGALGKPVIALLPRAFNWRWPTGREDSPWYSTARVLRPHAGDGWREPLRRTAAALAVMAEKKARL